MGEEVPGMNRDIAELRQTFRSGRTKEINWRKAQLRGILKLISDNEDKIYSVLQQDLGKHPVESYRDEIGIVKKSAKYALENLEKWMAPKKSPLPLLMVPSKAEVLPEPLGLVLIISSWNFPFSLALDPVIGAISAGNTVVLKPSELSPECSAFLAQTVPRYLDPEAIKVIEGGTDTAQQLLQQRWDKIFFTGSSRVGSIIMSAAAKYLTPVTLELGGKCPTIFDSLPDSDLEVAIKRIASGKWGPCSGQACIGVDYILVEKRFAPRLVELLKKCIEKFYGDSVDNLKNMCRIVNKHHFNRVLSLLEDPSVSATVVYGGTCNEQNLMIQPTILLDPPLDSDIMSEEIFGPLLPIITLDNIEESIEFINLRPKPLALYAFTKNEAFKKRLSAETSSGSITFNDTMIQFLCDTLPFGGVGPSGMGRYHGKYSFDTFSHEKAVLQRSFLLELEPRHPPWNSFKLDFIRMAYDFDYFGLLMLLSGLRSLFRLGRRSS
ncbi:OLC1v1010963C1 [Oldenlandia corymbosa var. corymbosa]|uniref:Aldehyde dehydrogenase n=1 Tax=Oldenlandia corymbosa var. corymbosa TaxID=529605 RepID=A0AAV1DUX7_OLDCO|nr:OLC1v1010963C1 [Oldenlandia corymbosa var. corymbosa]